MLSFSVGRNLLYNKIMAQINILLVDDHEVVRLGLKSLIDRHHDFSVVAEAATEEEAVEKAQSMAAEAA